MENWLSRLSLIVAANVFNPRGEENISFSRTKAAFLSAELASSLNISNFQILSIKMELE